MRIFRKNLKFFDETSSTCSVVAECTTDIYLREQAVDTLLAEVMMQYVFVSTWHAVNCTNLGQVRLK